MARANRHFIPGQVWHITHRCHKREFLLKFSKDRKNWHSWLFEAKKRFGLSVLDYISTSNHIHLLVFDTGKNVIPQSIQLIASRVGQEYNQRKERKGAFWEDRYHATAVENDSHLMKCLVYIDLNMVRAGAVKHPSEWESSGYNEIQEPPKRYSIIDWSKLLDLCGFSEVEQFRNYHRQCVADMLDNGSHLRESHWTESIAVGSPKFIEETKSALGCKVGGKKVDKRDGECVLREESIPFNADLALKGQTSGASNAFIWDYDG